MKSLWIIIGVIVVSVLLIVALAINFKGQPSQQASALAALDTSKDLFMQANASLEKGEYLQAREKYQRLINEFPNSPNLADAKKRLEGLNIKIIFSRLSVPGKTQMYTVKPGDVLEQIARKFNTTVELIKKSNNLTSDMIHPDQELRIWSARFSCIVDKSQNILTLKSDEDIIKTYIVSTGTNNCTPVGTFKIVNRLPDPVWYKAGAIVLPESPDNILGSRWLGFDIAGYGIHGTTQPETIGQQLTQGCVRMVNRDVEEVYDLLPVGTEVIVID